MRVIICGSREGLRPGLDIYDAVEASGFRITEVVHGGARGVDTQARWWAEANGYPHKPFPIPDWVWDHLGKRAGPIRNKHMAMYADACIAFPGGRGTQSMIEQAELHSIKVFRYGWE